VTLSAALKNKEKQVLITAIPTAHVINQNNNRNNSPFKVQIYEIFTHTHTDIIFAECVQVGCVAQLAERRSLAGELTLSCARPAADG